MGDRGVREAGGGLGGSWLGAGPGKGKTQATPHTPHPTHIQGPQCQALSTTRARTLEARVDTACLPRPSGMA
jgi:hypothetical protein